MSRTGDHGRVTGDTRSVAAPGQVADEWTGRVIDGRYEVRDKLGAGGMGTVYRGYQASLKREVAIKVMKPSAGGVDGERFARETELASQLVHPNIVTVHDTGRTHDGWMYLVMELVSGRTLKQELVHEGPLPRQRIIDIASQLCDALAFAHKRDIVHRDLKPSNIMINDEGVVKILDFGIAKSLADDAPVVTVGNDPLGTPIYMSPEALRGDDVTPSSDLYSLGCTLYETAEGNPPFRAPSIHSLFDLHQSALAPRIRRDDLADLAAIFERLLAKDPASRYPDAAALRLALQTPASRRTWPRLAIAALGLGAVAAAGWAVYAVTSSGDNNTEPSGDNSTAIHRQQPADAATANRAPTSDASPTPGSVTASPTPNELDAAPSPTGSTKAPTVTNRPAARVKREHRSKPSPRPRVVEPTTCTTPDCTDSDGDKVVDAKDSCPSLFGANARGCPRSGTRLTLAFVFGIRSTTLDARGRKRLDALVQTIKQNPGLTRIEVRGHASGAEGLARTQWSWRRAELIKSRLIAQGVAARRLRLYGYGQGLYNSSMADVVVAPPTPAKLSGRHIALAKTALEARTQGCLPRSMGGRRTATLRLHVGANGRVGKVEVTTNQPTATTCLRKRVRSFRFKRSRAAVTVVELKVDFH